ncbi:MAG: hypothetical protein V2J65_37020 [Desulfobacteraceae bacterium]|jgi:hypothetical protein|nr:hypothetical protein [Desulfobacteraceae bacterium]
MSLEYSINDHCIVVTAHGVTPLEEVVMTFERLAADAAFQPPANILLDARHTEHGPPSEELEALVNSLVKLDAFKGSRWATVANPNTLVFGVARMFCCLAESEGFCIEPFSDYEAACAWLREPEFEVSS